MELPLFDGGDALGWLVRIERYFAINNIAGEERMELVLIALEGRALNWYQTWEDQMLYPSWRMFREAVIRRFQPGVVKDPYGPLLKLKQVGSVIDYVDQFERISGPLRNIDREILKSVFINGLRGKLQAQLKSMGLETLAEVKDKALMLEERNREWKGGGVTPIERGVGFNRVPAQNRGGHLGKAPWGNKEGSVLKGVEASGGEKGGGVGKKLS